MYLFTAFHSFSQLISLANLRMLLLLLFLALSLVQGQITVDATGGTTPATSGAPGGTGEATE